MAAAVTCRPLVNKDQTVGASMLAQRLINRVFCYFIQLAAFFHIFFLDSHLHYPLHYNPDTYRSFSCFTTNNVASLSSLHSINESLCDSQYMITIPSEMSAAYVCA